MLSSNLKESQTVTAFEIIVMFHFSFAQKYIAPTKRKRKIIIKTELMI